jgi:tRNA-binding protein
LISIVKGKGIIEHDHRQDFERVELRVGTGVEVNEFPGVRKPAYRLLIDFGEEIGLRKCSAQITDLYSQASLVGKRVIALVNFPPKQVGPFMSECLLTGFANADGAIVLAVPDGQMPDGSRLM